MSSEHRQALLEEYETLKSCFAANKDNLNREDLTRLEALLKDQELAIRHTVSVRRLEGKIKECFERNNTYEDHLSLFQEAPEVMSRADMRELISLHGKLHPDGQESLKEMVKAMEDLPEEENDEETHQQYGVVKSSPEEEEDENVCSSKKMKRKGKKAKAEGKK